MSKKFRPFKKDFQGVTLIIIIFLLFSCKAIDRLEPRYWQEYTIASSEGEFMIDSHTILKSIAQGRADAFIPRVTGTPEANNIMPTGPVRWSQSDYLTIAQSVFNLVWGDPWQIWAVDNLFFRMDCDQAVYGPQIFSIRMYKIVHLRDEDSRLVREIFINPLDKTVDWTESEKYPMRERWESIDLNKIKVPAEAALQYSEENGGFKARSEIGNKCVIYAQLIASSIDLGWQIAYDQYGNDKDNSTVFYVNIDPFAENK